jgi:predicted DNA-binding transcriptional regulator YafY
LAIHRIKSAEALANKAIAPDGFDLDQSIQNGLLQFQRHKITEFEAIFDKNAAHHLLDTPLSMDQHITDIDDQHVRVTASIADTEQLKWWILGFGIKVKVLKPISLRKRIVEIVNGLHVIYATPSG